MSGTLTSMAAAVGPAPAQLLPARSQMGFTLGTHIILVPLGVVFPRFVFSGAWLRNLRRA